jgi:hypothetical protein
MLKVAAVGGIGALFYLKDLQQFFFGAPPVLTVLLALPPVALALDAWLIIADRSAIRRPGPAARMLIAAHLIVALGFAWWLFEWNLLGWRYG